MVWSVNCNLVFQPHNPYFYENHICNCNCNFLLIVMKLDSKPRKMCFKSGWPDIKSPCPKAFCQAKVFFIFHVYLNHVVARHVKCYQDIVWASIWNKTIPNDVYLLAKIMYHQSWNLDNIAGLLPVFIFKLLGQQVKQGVSPYIMFIP